MQIQGETINKWLYRFSTTSMLNVIEAEVINILRNKTEPDKIKSTLNEITESINNNQVLTGRINEYYYIIDSIKNISIYLNLNTGQLTDNSKIDDTVLHSSQRECPSCEFVNEIDNEVGFVNYIPGASQLVLKEIYQPGYTHRLYSCLKEEYGDMVRVVTQTSGLLSYFGYLNPFSLEILSSITFENFIPAAIVIAIPMAVPHHWDRIDKQELYKDEYVNSHNMENYAITDGYLSFSMHDYDAYNNITYNNPQELKDNHKVIRITIGRWGKLDYSDMIVYDNDKRRLPTVAEYNYYYGRYDSALDYYMFGIL